MTSRTRTPSSPGAQRTPDAQSTQRTQSTQSAQRTARPARPLRRRRQHPGSAPARVLLATAVGLVALVAGACSPPTPGPGGGGPSGSSYTLRATKVDVVAHNDAFLQGTRDEPFIYNLWFRVKLGVPNSAVVGVSGSRGSATMSLANGEGRYLFSTAEQGAVDFDDVRLFDIGDLLNPNNHLEVVGSWTWAMESDNISVKGLADDSAALLRTALNNTLGTMTVPSDAGALVGDLIASIPHPFQFFAGGALASIPGLTDDVVGSNIYAGVAATGTLASVLDAATASVKIPFIEIPIVGIPPDIGLNPGGGGHIFSLSQPRTFSGEDFSQWNSGHHRYEMQMVPTGTPLAFTQIRNAHYARCADLSYANADGGLVDPWPCNGNGRQGWVLTSGGQIQTPVRTNRCIDAGAGGNGATVSSQGCNGSAGQQWRISGQQLVNGAQNLCLGIPGQPVSGTHLKLRPCSAADPEQQWTLEPLDPLDYQRVRFTDRDRCAGVAGADTDNGAAVLSWMCTDAPDQGWYLDPQGFLINRGSDRCLDGNGGQAGAEVLIWNCSDVPWQRWERAGTQLVNSYRNTCLAVSNNQELPGARLRLVACDTADPAQRVLMEPATPWAWTQLRNPDAVLCAQAADNDSANGTIVRGSDCATYQATGQGWKLDPGGLVLSRIDGGANGKCLDATTGAVGAAVVMWDCHGGANQRWHVDGTRLVNDVAGQCLQAPATVDDPLRLAVCDSSSAQRWTLPLQ